MYFSIIGGNDGVLNQYFNHQEENAVDPMEMAKTKRRASMTSMPPAPPTQRFTTDHGMDPSLLAGPWWGLSLFFRSVEHASMSENDSTFSSNLHETQY